MRKEHKERSCFGKGVKNRRREMVSSCQMIVKAKKMSKNQQCRLSSQIHGVQINQVTMAYLHW